MKKAFTMLELVFVIVVIGILAAVVIPRAGSNRLHEAAVQVVSHIRYTQHLAMVDDKFNGSETDWHKRRWQLLFGTSADTNNKIAYSIFSDAPTFSGNPGISELAKNPMSSNKLLTGGFSGVISYATDSRVTREMNIGEKYGIGDVSFSAECSINGSKRIAFDYIGRPLRGALDSYTSSYPAADRLITSTCIITLISNDENVSIAIEPETGYAHIL